MKAERTQQNKKSETKDALSSNRRDSSLASKTPYSEFIDLQRTAGNQAVQGLLATGAIQAKLKIGEPNDKYEQEADRVADQVMRMSEPAVQRQSIENAEEDEELIQTKPNESLQRQPSEEEEEEEEEGELIQTKPLNRMVQRQAEVEEEEEETLQAKAAPGHTPIVGATTHAKINSLKGTGEPLSPSTRAFFEPRFGRDLSSVRIHTDSKASATARSINAKAFTVGRDVVFGSGQYQPQTTEGKRLLAHELVHVGQQRKAGNLAEVQRQAQPRCSVKNPESCPTYEQWVSAFTSLSSFISEDGVPRSAWFALAIRGRTRTTQNFRVLGGSVASRNPADPDAAKRPPARVGRRFLGDHFIDHPTDDWVKQNMPENLRLTAYQLHSNCADILVILRHVYLSAHHRTESYRGWIVGDALGRAAQSRISKVIDEAKTENLADVINPYSDNQGNPIRDFDKLEPLLHPGDQLVWDHHKHGLNRPRSGGHSQTIMKIRRDNTGHINELHMLQGNQPLFEDQAKDIVALTESTGPPLSRTRKENLLAKGGPYRFAPGRRIEVSIMRDHKMKNVSPQVRVWTWGDSDNTILKVAGPPRAAKQPFVRGIRGQRNRLISDWFRMLSRASMVRLHGIFEAALHEVRALIDGGQSVADQDAIDLGQRAGNQLWRLARTAVSRLTRFGQRKGDLRRGDLGHRVHFDQLHRIRAMIRALGGIQPRTYHGNPQAAQDVRNTFTLIDREFNFVARGGDNISFKRPIQRGGELVKILVTGFDPFNISNVKRPPRAGEWNPAGAAAMAMDGSTINLGRRDRAAVEGAVFPVSFAQFNQNIVERMAFQVSGDADAVLTVSVDPNLPATAPVRIEQFAVGVHNLIPLQPHRLFPLEPARPLGIQSIPRGGPAIRETAADVAGIARDTAARARRHVPQVQEPAKGREITLIFTTEPVALQAQSLGLGRRVSDQQVQSLGLGPQFRGRVLAEDNEANVRTLMQRAQRVTNQPGQSADIVFRFGNVRFQATLLRGPGGNFLSNEIAYRMQRELAARGSSARSFHVHTPPGSLIPQAQATDTRADRAARNLALAGARTTLVTLIATLRSMIRAVAQRVQRVLTRRQQQGGGSTP